MSWRHTNNEFGIYSNCMAAIHRLAAGRQKIVKRINELIKSIDRDGLSQGLRKPEPLRYRKAWSRRITEEHRLVYNFDNNQNLIIYSCKEHYED